MNTLFNHVGVALFKKTQGVFVSPPYSSDFGPQIKTVSTLAINLESYGYTLGKELVQALSWLNENDLVEFYQWMDKTLRYETGAYANWKPMYPNFPRQVMEASELELYLNALIHYAGSAFGVRLLPEYEKKIRLPLDKYPEPKVIGLLTEEKIQNVILGILNSNASLSPENKITLEALFGYLYEQGKVATLLEQSRITQKETLALVGKLVITKGLDFTCIEEQFKTTTDVLRLISAFSSDDVSLSINIKFKNFSRPVRRVLLKRINTLLENSQALENMNQYREMWVRVAEKLHPGEFKQFALAQKAFDALRNKHKIYSFNSLTDKLFAAHDFDVLSEHLATRPGVMARTINRFATQANTAQIKTFTQHFERVAREVSTPVLLQVHNHFKNGQDKVVRTFLPKGALAKAWVQDCKPSSLSKDVTSRFVQICENTLIERFSHLPALGKVYVDEALKTQHTPFALRSASKALKTVARGSEMSVEDSEVIRFFIWWNESFTDDKGQRESVGRIDLDLSAVLLDENFHYVTQCAWTNLRDSGMVHSGDIVSAPNGACEFIDLHKEYLDPRARYVVMTVNSYTHQPYCEIPECFAGWMTRNMPQKGEIFDARLVQNKIDLTGDTGTMIPMVIDIVENCIIWTDISMKGGFYNSTHSQLTSMAWILKGMLNLHKPNLYDLFSMHAKARGVLCDNKEEAEHIFSLHEGVTPFDSDVITSKYMVEEIKPDINLTKMKF